MLYAIKLRKLHKRQLVFCCRIVGILGLIRYIYTVYRLCDSVTGAPEKKQRIVYIRYRYNTACNYAVMYRCI